MEIREREIKDLIHAEYNPRQLKKDQHQQLKDSLLRFGVVDPVIVNVHPDRKDIIVGGHQRTKVWESMGNTTISTVEVSLTLEQERELNVRLNKNTGEFDFDMLANHFDVDELKEWGFDEKELSFDTEEEAEEDDFEIPDEVKTDIVLGDLIEIGEHRLLCGDSTDSDQVAKLMDGEKADMLTDPPYGININMNMGRIKGQKNKFEQKDWDKEVPDFYYLIALFENQIIWGGNYFNLPNTKNWLCWDKKTRGLDQGEFELAWTSLDINTRILNHHWSGEKKLHPTMKPVPVMGWCLEHLKSINIFDPFLGSGSTMVACEQLSRKCYGMELDPKYCQVIIDRMIKLNPDICVKINGNDYGLTN